MKIKFFWKIRESKEEKALKFFLLFSIDLSKIKWWEKKIFYSNIEVCYLSIRWFIYTMVIIYKPNQTSTT